MTNVLFDAAGLTVFERGWLSSNNVLFAGDTRHPATLVDSGYVTHAAQTVALVRQALGARRLDWIVNTHLHSDHCGGNAALQAAFDCSVAIPSVEARNVDEWNTEQLSYEATGQQCPRFTRMKLLDSGEHVQLGARQWSVVSAPGHDPASIVLHEPDLGILISADAFWENGFGAVFPEIEGEHAFDAVRATLQEIEKLNVRCVIPGHGRPFFDVAEALARANRRLDGFINDPARHALYAAKVLLKFHLLEVKSQRLSDLSEWMTSTLYLRLLHRRHFSRVSWPAWCQSLTASLSNSGAADIRDGVILNC